MNSQLNACVGEAGHGKAKLIFEPLFETVEIYNKVKVFAVDANEENMDRLEEVIKAIDKNLETHSKNNGTNRINSLKT